MPVDYTCTKGIDQSFTPKDSIQLNTVLGKQQSQSIPANTSCVWMYTNTLTTDAVLTIQNTSAGGYTYFKYFESDKFKILSSGNSTVALGTNDTYVAPGSNITVPSGGGFAIIFIVPIGKTPTSF